MTTTELDAIEAAVLQLPQTDRAHLAERLLASLDEDDEILAAWIAEAEKRADALARGNTRWMPIDQAMLKARAASPRPRATR